MKYTVKHLKDKNILIKQGGIEYTINTTPYLMDANELDGEWEGKTDDCVITFYDGFAIDNNNTILIRYKTIRELLDNEHTDWSEIDFYGDNQINYFQIQYIHFIEELHILTKEIINDLN